MFDLIYIAQPFGGDFENVEEAEKLLNMLTFEYPDKCFVSPVLSFGSLYHELSYDDGMKLCYSLLNKCDELWYFGLSKGVRLEIDYAERNGIRVLNGKQRHNQSIKE